MNSRLREPAKASRVPHRNPTGIYQIIARRSYDRIMEDTP
jgi:hypothetical protein